MTNTIPTPTKPGARPTRERVEYVGHRALELMETIAAAQAELDQYKAEAAAWPVDKYLAGTDAQVVVTGWRKRDDERFQSDFPFSEYPHLYKFALDSQAVKNELAPIDLEPYMVAQTPRVSFKPLEPWSSRSSVPSTSSARRASRPRARRARRRRTPRGRRCPGTTWPARRPLEPRRRRADGRP
jgi:hypothetical protein